MNDQPAEVQIGYRVDCIIRELDELCRMAANIKTKDLIDRRHALEIWRIATRLNANLKIHDRQTNAA